MIQNSVSELEFTDASIYIYIQAYTDIIAYRTFFVLKDIA